jgi:hypothetical protein
VFVAGKGSDSTAVAPVHARFELHRRTTAQALALEQAVIGVD